VGDWSRDDVREVFLSVAAAGGPFGVPLETGLDAVTDVLDRPFEDDLDEIGLSLRRDWGFVVGFYSRDSLEAPWQWWGLDVRAHRLHDKLIWDELAGELTAHGYPVLPAVPDPGGDLVMHELPAAATTARKGGPEGLGTVLTEGQVYDVTVHRGPLLSPASKRWSHLRNVIRKLAPQGPDTWTAWLDEAAPDWEALLGALGKLHADQPARDDEWAAFGVWLLDEAQRRQVWPPWEWAYHRAVFVAGHPGIVPADEVAASCLEFAPTPPEVAAATVDWRRTRPRDVRHARLTRALLAFAGDPRFLG
jgi:hypothetical protein